MYDFPNCPKCNKQLKKVLFGEVHFTDPAAKEHYVIGGCMMPRENKPTYYCKECTVYYNEDLTVNKK